MNPVPDPTIPIESQPDQLLLSLLIWGEARGEHEPGMLAVGNVVRNRVLADLYGHGFRGVILAHQQFSCMNLSDPNREKLLEPLKHDTEFIWDACYTVASKILAGYEPDSTNSATHYYDRSMDLHPPSWARVFTHTVNIGSFRFYRDFRAFQPQASRPIESLAD